MANNRIRYNWGVCTNRDKDGNGTPCECCASKEKQKVLASHEFVCRVCGEPLQKVQAPKSFLAKYKGLIIGAVAVVVVGGVGAGIVLSGGGGEKNAIPSTDSVAAAKPDTAQAVKTTKDTTAKATETAPAAPLRKVPAAASASSAAPAPSVTAPAPKASRKVSSTSSSSASQIGFGRVNLGYGKYVGELKNGKPHGHGTITYTSSHQIVSSKDFVANQGDTYEGEFRDGRPASIGIWVHDGERTGVKP